MRKYKRTYQTSDPVLHWDYQNLFQAQESQIPMSSSPISLQHSTETLPSDEGILHLSASFHLGMPSFPFEYSERHMPPHMATSLPSLRAQEEDHFAALELERYTSTCLPSMAVKDTVDGNCNALGSATHTIHEKDKDNGQIVGLQESERPELTPMCAECVSRQILKIYTIWD